MMWSFSLFRPTRRGAAVFALSAAATGLFGCAEGSGEIDGGEGGFDASGGGGGFGGSVGVSSGGAGAGPGAGGMGGIVGTGGMGVGGFGGTGSTTSSTTTTTTASSSSSSGGGTCPGGLQCGAICCTDPLMTGVQLCCPDPGEGNCGVEIPFVGCECTDGCP